TAGVVRTAGETVQRQRGWQRGAACGHHNPGNRNPILRSKSVVGISRSKVLMDSLQLLKPVAARLSLLGRQRPRQNNPNRRNQRSRTSQSKMTTHGEG